MEGLLKCTLKQTVLFSKGHPRLPGPIQTDDTLVPKASHQLYLRLRFYSLNLSTQSTGILCRFFPLLTQDSTLSQKIKLTLNKLLIQSILIYNTPVWSSTCDSSYLKHKIVQNKSLWVIGNEAIHSRFEPGEQASLRCNRFIINSL
jgi:hypothetical protein